MISMGWGHFIRTTKGAMLPVMRAKGIWRGRVSDPYTYAQMWAATRKLQLFCAVSLGAG